MRLRFKEKEEGSARWTASSSGSWQQGIRRTTRRQGLAGFGTGANCDACDEPILRDQVEHALDFPESVTVRFHPTCAAIRRALVAEMAQPATPDGMLVHFRVDLDGPVFAACAPHISAETYKGKRLVSYAVFVKCPACNRGRAQAEGGRDVSRLEPAPPALT
jgi:hypothetical protein